MTILLSEPADLRGDPEVAAAEQPDHATRRIAAHASRGVRSRRAQRHSTAAGADRTTGTFVQTRTSEDGGRTVGLRFWCIVVMGEAPEMARPGDKIAAGARGYSYLRASDADREQVIAMLKAAYVQGRLAKDELDARVSEDRKSVV